MTREELMLAVVEAAREVATTEVCGDAFLRMVGNVRDALSALDAHRPEPEGEMVTLGILQSRHSGNYIGAMDARNEDPRHWQHVCNITFRAPPISRIPEIRATVEKVK